MKGRQTREEGVHYGGEIKEIALPKSKVEKRVTKRESHDRKKMRYNNSLNP